MSIITFEFTVQKSLDDVIVLLYDKAVRDVCRDLSIKCSEYRLKMASFKHSDTPAHRLWVKFSESCKLSYGSISCEISKEKLVRLSKLYRNNDTASDNDEVTISGDVIPVQMPNHFWYFVLVMCMRYKIAVGERGGGLHAAVDPMLMSLLSSRMHVVGECFASPFNCWYDLYCSAFKDVDTYFGSRGSFFTTDLPDGMYECNPPFVEEVILMMVDRMKMTMTNKRSTCDDVSNRAIGYVVFIPNWEDCEGLQRLRDSKYCVHDVLLPAKQHKYVCGEQHISYNTFNAVHGTRVFVLQNKRAREKYEIDADVLTGNHIALIDST